jgi:glutathione S-transferase
MDQAAMGDTAMQLYELTGEDGASVCPFVWRVKFALAQKGLSYQSREVGFLEIPQILDGTYKSVPVLVDRGHALGDSWLIADHLDQAYPDAVPLFRCPGERSLTRFVDSWLNTQILPKLLTIYVLDIHNRARPIDRDYFRKTREARLGRTLEEVNAGRNSLVAELRIALEPLRQTLAKQAFLSGDEPGYGDFMAVGVIMWGASVGTTAMLEHTDPLLAWVERCLDLYGGVGRQIVLPGLKTLPATV